MQQGVRFFDTSQTRAVFGCLLGGGMRKADEKISCLLEKGIYIFSIMW